MDEIKNKTAFRILVYGVVIQFLVGFAILFQSGIDIFNWLALGVVIFIIAYLLDTKMQK